jgi:ribosomal protein L40E
MPAKPCPKCGLKNPTSATTCDCGYTFGGQRLPGTAELICPRCHTINPATATQCECGHAFVEDTEKVREALTEQLSKSRRMLLAGVMIILVTLALGLLLGGHGLLFRISFGAIGVALLVRGWRGLARARGALDLLGPPVTAPVARIVKE